MSAVREQIAACCKRLRLRRMTDNLDLVDEQDPESFLLRLLELEVAHRDRSRVERAIKDAGFYTPKYLDDFIFDEWGYVPVNREGAQLLFYVVSACYEKRSMIVTTNVEFGLWVTIFLDQAMTTALIDRLVHHSHLLIFDGESHRVKNSLMRQ